MASAAPKVVLLTGATDGIGLEAAKMLVSQGQHVLLHGRNPAKLEESTKALENKGGKVESFVADLSKMSEVDALAKAVTAKHSKLDVLINNAGVFKVPSTMTADKLDVRFAVNTLAPYMLTQKLLPLIGSSGRVINVCSAAQAPVDLRALAGKVQIEDDFNAYAQSKLGIMMWSRTMAQTLKDGPTVIAVNPGSMLGTKMVQDGFGVAGNDIAIGGDILKRLALDAEFASRSGEYFDNDARRFNKPHPDMLHEAKCEALVKTMEEVLASIMK